MKYKEAEPAVESSLRSAMGYRETGPRDCMNCEYSMLDPASDESLCVFNRAATFEVEENYVCDFWEFDEVPV
jgi:hypothetical protein